MAKAFAAAFRNLRRAPAFTALVVLTLALGIGATTAMFSVVDAVLINPLPFAKADRIVEVWTYFQEGATRAPGATSTVVATIRQEPGVFESVGAYQFGAGTITGAGDPETISVAGLSPGIFSVFPVAPLHGRLFAAADTTSGERVILISERLWTSRFSRDPGVVGSAVTIDDVSQRVVGVLPARFNVPESSVGAWRPVDIESANVRQRVQLIGVLHEGVTKAQVDDRLKTLTAALQESGALPKGQYLVTDVPLQIRYGRNGATSLSLLMGAVGLLLLVACVNISNLILVRASSRRGQLALMAALGAGRSRLLRDAAIESVMLAVIGGALGLWLANGLLQLILGLAPENMLMLSSATGALDLRAVAFATTLTLATCVLFSLLPAWRASRADPIDALKQQSPSAAGSRDDWWQGALVSGQLALVVVLLAGAGLLLRSYVALNRVELGFDPHGLVVVGIQMPTRYAKGGTSRAFMREVESRVEAAIGTPASVSMPPLGFTVEDDARPEVEGAAPASQVMSLPWSIGRVSADFFDVAGVAIVEGRTFRPDDSDRSIIVNDVFARRYFGSLSPIGRRFRSEPTLPWLTVVGVAADIKVQGPADAIGGGAEIYFPMVPGDSRYLSLMVRAGNNEAAVLARVRQIIWDLDPNMPILEAKTMTEMLGDSIARPRFLASLSGAFTICAVLIAAVGVYGVSMYWVARRRRELAIRLAVGASPDRLLLIVIARSLRLAAIGTIAGLAIAIAGARVMTALLFATDPRDPLTFIGITLLLGVVAILACVIPALKAARVDPMTTLRTE
jgi:putative ABC transport system permease protein